LSQTIFPFGPNVIQCLTRQLIRLSQFAHSAPGTVGRHHFYRNLHSICSHYIISSCCHGLSPCVVFDSGKTIMTQVARGFFYLFVKLT
jgi:hypothetical protein